ncbi:hypothetical protein C8Q74DRAFT_1257976 [Fomes fomentarius]|nr:hypothetical protein C8Q74DRAFT_1257976 [Fomes fomentarius]
MSLPAKDALAAIGAPASHVIGPWVMPRCRMVYRPPWHTRAWAFSVSNHSDARDNTHPHALPRRLSKSQKCKRRAKLLRAHAPRQGDMLLDCSMCLCDEIGCRYT